MGTARPSRQRREDQAVALDLYNNTQYEQAVQNIHDLRRLFPEDFEALFNSDFATGNRQL